jgi:hypothetical protein
MCDDVLKQAVEGISDLITTPGVINIDFADIKAIMENAGPALKKERKKPQNRPLILPSWSCPYPAPRECFFQSPAEMT